MHLQERHYLTFDLEFGFKVICIVAEYPQHYVIYTPATFEGAMSKGSGDVFTRKYIL